MLDECIASQSEVWPQSTGKCTAWGGAPQNVMHSAAEIPEDQPLHEVRDPADYDEDLKGAQPEVVRATLCSGCKLHHNPRCYGPSCWRIVHVVVVPHQHVDLSLAGGDIVQSLRCVPASITLGRVTVSAV